MSDRIAHNIVGVLHSFGVEAIDCGENTFCACPIHGGDNPSGFSINTDEYHPYFGTWMCWTQGCHEDGHVNTPIGLVRALLSNKLDREVSFPQAIEYCLKITDADFDKLKEDSENVKFSSAAAKHERYEQKRIQNKEAGVTREKVRNHLKIPAKYYLDRGYTKEVLNQFDVGVCPNPKNLLMKDRIIVPVYDDDFECMVGHLGRVSHENFKDRKWVNSEGFYSGVWLYGYWLSKDFIRQSKSAILVEGQGDVWRLWESGIRNAVGMFGSSLSDAQLRILETSGALNVVIITDSDQAGEKARKSISKKCSRMFNIIDVRVPSKDVGDLSVSEVQQIIKPQIKGYTND